MSRNVRASGSIPTFASKEASRLLRLATCFGFIVTHGCPVVERRQMLNLVAVDRGAERRRLRIEKRRLRAIDSDRLRRLPKIKLYIDSVGLLWTDLNIPEGLLLESVFLHS